MKAFTNEAKYYDLFHRDKDYAKEAQKIKDRFPDAKTVLEIGCGTGNLTIELEKLGFEVTGIEPSSAMLYFFKRNLDDIHWCTFQDFIPPKDKFDLVLAMYDVLNYIPRDEIDAVGHKINSVGKQWWVETWPVNSKVKWFTYKSVDKCHRVRLGFKFKKAVHLWFIFWGKGLVITKHKLYL